MDSCLKDWLDIGIKVLGLGAVIFAALSYYKHGKLKRGEWLQLLFEKFYENKSYKEVRKWLDSGEIEQKVNIDDDVISNDDEQFTDFLNFFEFIAKLEFDGHLKYQDIKDMFDYYLKNLNIHQLALAWINKYGFEKLRNLLNKIN